jgi:hypothetical protein
VWGSGSTPELAAESLLAAIKANLDGIRGLYGE